MTAWSGFDAVLFDLDGVLTKTQTLHRAAWDELFANVLPALDATCRPYTQVDYFAYVDGRPRVDGVRAVLESRNLYLPEGDDSDPSTAMTVHGIGRRKDEAFLARMERDGVEVYQGAVRFLDALQIAGTRVALVTSSKNAQAVLSAARLGDRFEVIVDGRVLTDNGLAGKPAPDSFLYAAQLLGVPASRCAVIEDAISGVQAGSAGGFARVVGVDIGAGYEDLRAAGAHLVVSDLGMLADDVGAIDPLNGDTWPLHPWRVTVKGVPRDAGAEESVLSVGNGYLGWRADPEEGSPAHSRGTYVNGFHETRTLEHAEDAVGFARVGQTLVEVPDAKQVTIIVDDEPLNLSTSDISELARQLDMRRGVLTRDLLWTTHSGKRVRVSTSRCVSWAQRHLALMSVTVTPLGDEIDVVITSTLVNRNDGSERETVTTTEPALDPRRARSSSGRILLPVSHEHDGTRGILAFRTATSGMRIAVGVDHQFDSGTPARQSGSCGPDRHEVTWRTRTRESVTIRKFVSVHTRNAATPVNVTDRVRHTLDRALEHGHDKVWSDHEEAVAGYWERSDVRVVHDMRLQQAIRWSIFQVGCASFRSDGLGVSAKGVSGSGYEGHYFWDTEIYVAPMLTYTNPEVARNLMHFRYSMLDDARTRASEVSQSGALFPWRTINGREASAYYAAGTAQYHIDADIAYAVDQYVRASGDQQFMKTRGVDILVETARMWADLGFWRRGRDESFHIFGVTGPDEYTTVVNNNLFTNAMARFNLRRAAEVVISLLHDDPEAYGQIVRRLGISESEVESWAEAAAKMHIGFDVATGIHPQDDQFLTREVWDLPNTPSSKRPLLLHYHPLVIYRFQVIKQADVVLALALLRDDFTAQEKLADFEYYEPLTTGDSTLSAVVQAIVAAEVGYSDLAVEHFTHSAFIDLTNSHANTDAGVHVAAAGGVWSALVFGFAGMNDRGQALSFDPRLPADWPSLSFRVAWRGSRIAVAVHQESITFSVDGQDEVDVQVRGKLVTVKPSVNVTVELHGQGPVRHGRPASTALSGQMRSDGTFMEPSLPLS